jgi:hypothetical protein
MLDAKMREKGRPTIQTAGRPNGMAPSRIRHTPSCSLHAFGQSNRRRTAGACRAEYGLRSEDHPRFQSQVRRMASEVTAIPMPFFLD